MRSLSKLGRTLTVYRDADAFLERLLSCRAAFMVARRKALSFAAVRGRPSLAPAGQGTVTWFMKAG